MPSVLTSDQVQESIDLNNNGCRILNSGQVESGLALIEKSCELGLPNALATLIWTKLLLNDVDGAMNSYQKYLKPMENWFTSAGLIVGEESAEFQFGDQRFNVATNYATALYLSGADTRDVLAACEQANQKRWAEAMVLSLAAMNKEIAPSLTRKNILDLKRTCHDIQEGCELYSKSHSDLVHSAPKITFTAYAQQILTSIEKYPVYELDDEMTEDFRYGDRMSIGEMAEIFVEFLKTYVTSDFSDFYAKNGLTLRVAVGLNTGLVKITSIGFDAFEKAWFEMCDLFDADPDALYDSLDDLMGVNFEE